MSEDYPRPKDWVTTVIKDLEFLNLNLKFEEIKKMQKSRFRNLIKQSIQEKTLKDLNAV